MPEVPIERLLRALLNLGSELRTLSFAVTTPPVPDWFQPDPKGAPSDGDAYDRQRLIEWPQYWIDLRIAELTRRSAAGRLPI